MTEGLVFIEYNTLTDKCRAEKRRKLKATRKEEIIAYFICTYIFYFSESNNLFLLMCKKA
jgi:hypothetical protein